VTQDRGPASAVHKRTIFLARHGLTESNRSGSVIGRSDSPLTAEGIASVEAVARTLEPESIGVIVSSPLGRALASASIFSERLGLPIIVSELYEELSGGQWQGKPRAQVTAGKRELRVTWTDRPPGGESYANAESRVAAVIGKVESLETTGDVLVVGHAAVNRVFLKLKLNLTPEVACRIRCPHETVYIIGPDGDVLHASPTGSRGRGLLIDD
jgi:broad specificity phosphatase PhoE